MNQVYQKLEQCFQAIRKKTDFIPQAGLVLGSGLGDFAEQIDIACRVDYKEMEGFPVSTVEGHSGQFVFGRIGDVRIVIMKGRVHHYEGYEISDVVLPVRLMKRMGAERLILTNAAGGLNPGFKAGEFMLIKDQISSFLPSPLTGPNIEEWGPRFPPMEGIYDEEMSVLMKDVAEKFDIPLREGIYVQTQGPNYESPAEVKMYRLLGGDAVGMSTAVEAIAARHMGMRICGVSCISNMASGMGTVPLSHEEVGRIAKEAAPAFQKLLKEYIRKLG